MSNENDDRRELGIDLGTLPEKLESRTFPVEKTELLAERGDHEIALANGETRTLADVLDPVGVERFESADDLRRTLYQMVGSEAVGREGSTGRGTSDITPPPDQRASEEDWDDEASL